MTECKNFKINYEYRIIPAPKEVTEEWLNNFGKMGWAFNGWIPVNKMLFYRATGASANVDVKEE